MIVLAGICIIDLFIIEGG